MNSNMRFLSLTCVVVFNLLFSGCNSKKSVDNYTDTPTTGEVSIAVDETFQRIIEAELPVFHAIRQLKLTACPYFSGAMDSNTPVASVQVRVFWNTNFARLYRGIIHRVTRSHPVNNLPVNSHPVNKVKLKDTKNV